LKPAIPNLGKEEKSIDLTAVIIPICGMNYYTFISDGFEILIKR